MKSLFWTILAAIYLMVRFGMTRQLDAAGAYASYFLECVLVVIVIGLAPLKYFSTLFSRFPFFIATLPALVLGYAAYWFAGYSGIPIPFDLAGTETLVFLLLVAPVLEELIFRYFLWTPFATVTKSPVATWIVTSLLFAYSHYHSLWFMPAELASFVTYQTMYTLVLGAYCGWWMCSRNSLAGAIATHFCFNVGFYLGSVI